jgi:hypothetical protein
LHWEAERILGKYRADWLRVLPWWADDFGGTWFKRGFAYQLTPLSNHFTKELRTVPISEPITHLTVRCTPNNVPAERLLKLRGLDRIRVLDFSCHDIGDEGAKALAACPQLGQLVELNVSVNEIGPNGIRALVRSRHLPHLERLDISSNRLGKAGIAALAGSRLPALKGLTCGALELGAEGLETLLHSDTGRRLTALTLEHGSVASCGPQPE